ncbi:MAG: TRAP transporter large permease [Firmicutes bacterium]|nr:TRAP transporter large permease [Bacillota bacterium]
MSALMAGIVGIAAFLALMALRVPIAVGMAVVGFFGFSYVVSPEAALRVVAKDFYSVFSSYSLSVIPMFAWMGYLAFYAGIGSQLFSFAYKLLGRLPGGLAIATQAACAVFGAVCGSSTATAATIGAISLPEMKKYRYDPSLATASVASGGAIGIMIPPSVIFVVYGIATEQSIGRLFIAGITPGVVLTLAYIIAILAVTARNPSLGPPAPPEKVKEIPVTLAGGVLDIFLIFVISLGGLFAGLFTPTEAGAVGTACVFLVSLARGRINRDVIARSLSDTTRTTAMIMFLIAGATIFGRFIAVTRIPFELANWAGSLPLPPFVVLGIVLMIYLILGCFIDALAMILLTVPIFYPVVVETLGYDPIWFGVMIVMVVAIGVITPPVGMNVYVIKGVAKDVPLETIFRGVWPFLIAAVVCCVLFTAFPGIVTFLPDLLMP